MRAVLVRAHGPSDSPRVEEIPDLVPREGEVIVESRAIGVNYPDLLVIEGKYQPGPSSALLLACLRQRMLCVPLAGARGPFGAVR